MTGTRRRRLRLTPTQQTTLIDLVLAYRLHDLRELMRELQLPVSGTKPEIRERIADGLEDDSISAEVLIQFLNKQAPLSKQHIYLYTGITSRNTFRRKESWEEMLRPHQLGNILDSQRPLLLPSSLTLSTIRHSPERVAIYATSSHSYSERDHSFDETKEAENGDIIELRGYRYHVSRITVLLRWNLMSNAASLHITQLPSRASYEDMREEFFSLIRPWFPQIDQFQIENVHRAIKRLHELHDGNQGETDSHKIGYRTPSGIDVIANSSSASASMHDDGLVDDSMSLVRDGPNVNGHIANLWFLPRSETPQLTANPLSTRTRVEIIGYHNRINVPTPQPQDAIDYVLERIRRHCGQTP